MSTSINKRYIEVFQKKNKEGKLTNEKWERIQKSDLAEYIKTKEYFSCFSTLQSFVNKEKSERDNLCLSPFFFDIDFKEDLEIAQKETLMLIDYLILNWQLSENDFEIYFSGYKGFHIVINHKVLGIEESNILHLIFKYILQNIIFDIEEQFQIKLQAVDKTVYTKKRQFRIENTQHETSKKYKIPITLSELQSDISIINSLAENPRLYSNESYLNNKKYKLNEKAEIEYNKLANNFTEIYNTSIVDEVSETDFKFTKDEYPVCVKDILDNGWKEEGQRNIATIHLSTYFKLAGYTVEETENILVPWVKRFTSSTNNSEIYKKMNNTKTVINTVFESSNYKFGCEYIRSLGIEENPVKCAWNNCKFIPQDKDTAEELTLNDTSIAEHLNKPIYTNVMIAGHKQTPYIIPKEIKYTCLNRENCKKDKCPLYLSKNHEKIRRLKNNDRRLVEMTNATDLQVRSILKQISGIPDCKSYEIEIIKTVNIDEIICIPKAEETGKETASYVLKKAFVLDKHKQIDENKYYRLFGYPITHPKTQESTLMVVDLEPLQDEIEEFQMTDDINQKLKQLQPDKWTVDSITEKLGILCDNLSAKVTKILERDYTMLGLLLVYHSIIRFNVPWKTSPSRGWLELIIVGDTGTGKSALIENFMDFVNLGTGINAESSTRTGITYKLENVNGGWFIVWGKYPRADKKLLWIDEGSGITKDEYGLMTQARTSGVLEVSRAVNAETLSRVRFVISTNAPSGRRLSEYPVGVLALKDLFNNEDIRRFDFAIFMKANDIQSDVYNKIITESNTDIENFDVNILKESILHAWSRTENQVVFESDAIHEITNVSKEISDMYGKATEVPIVSPSDQKDKIARLAVALASLTFSVDLKGNIVVKACHVSFIQKYLESMYNTSAMGLNRFVKQFTTDEEITKEEYTRLKDGLIKGLSPAILKRPDFLQEFVSQLETETVLRSIDIEAYLDLDINDTKAIIKWMKKEKLITLTKDKRSHEKTAKFNSFVDMYYKEVL